MLNAVPAVGDDVAPLDGVATLATELLGARAMYVAPSPGLARSASQRLPASRPTLARAATLARLPAWAPA